MVRRTGQEFPGSEDGPGLRGNRPRRASGESLSSASLGFPKDLSLRQEQECSQRQELLNGKFNHNEQI